jgi:isochorismate synthase EntC
MNQIIQCPFPAVKHAAILPAGSGLIPSHFTVVWSFLRVRAPLTAFYSDERLKMGRDFTDDAKAMWDAISWIEQMLTATAGHRLDKNVFVTALELDFNPIEAPQQLITAINWGRYAELFGFDDDNNRVFLGATLGNPELAEDELDEIFKE